MTDLKMEKAGKFTYVIPRMGNMKVDVILFLSERIKVEDEAIKQITDAASIDEESIVLATPDIHTGYGVPIGSILVTPNFISPSAVGYDINCGMRLLTSPFEATEIDTETLAEGIARLIPLGEGKKNLKMGNREMRNILNRGLEEIEDLLERFGLLENSEGRALLAEDIERTEDRGSLWGNAAKLPPTALERGMPQMGTLGGGNHFIELQRVEEVFDTKRASRLGLFQGQFTVMIHSGSRGLGHETAGFYMKKAKSYMARENLIPPNGQLLYFKKDSPEAEDYLEAMNGAANYAFANREVMAVLVRKALRDVLGKKYSSHLKTLYDVTHNIAKEETYGGKHYFVHRKGATRAYDARRMAGTPFEDIGQPVLIPGSMGTASYVLLGHSGSEKSFFSVNHGAGRVLSRKQAAGKKGKEGLISDRDFKRAMEGIYLICEDRRRIKEEAPQAYKDIDEVIEVVTGAGLALPVAKLKPIAVLKG